MGWKTKGDLDPKFEEVAFALEPSSTSSPKFAEVKTGFGYHIIMVSTRSSAGFVPISNPTIVGGGSQVVEIQRITRIS